MALSPEEEYGLSLEELRDYLVTAEEEVYNMDLVLRFLRERADSQTFQDYIIAFLKEHYWEDFQRYIIESHLRRTSTGWRKG